MNQNPSGVLWFLGPHDPSLSHSVSPVLDNRVVKHYKLRKTEDGRHYVSSSKVFATLTELVHHYCNQADGLCVRLGEPCRRVRLSQPLLFSASHQPGPWYLVPGPGSRVPGPQFPVRGPWFLVLSLSSLVSGP